MTLDEIKSRINPQYMDCPGTESYERKWLCDRIEALEASLRVKDLTIGQMANDAQRRVDAWPQAHRLALELECLLIDCKDTAAVSKWWDSAHDALDEFRKVIEETRHA